MRAQNRATESEKVADEPVKVSAESEKTVESEKVAPESVKIATEHEKIKLIIIKSLQFPHSNQITRYNTYSCVL